MNNIVDHLITELTQFQASHAVERWVVGLSGGVDSVVLLHGVVAANRYLSQPLSVAAVHINHQLSPQANRWVAHCRAMCEELNVDCVVETVDVCTDGKGVESAARDARYQAFEQQLNTKDVLLLGHHLHDQSETVLLRLLRGAGVQGLTAMPTSRSLGRSHLLRPMLSISKSDIEAYAHQQSLSWVDDESNLSSEYDRNFLRHNIIPQLEQRWPAVHQQLSKQVSKMTQAHQVLQDMASLDFQKLSVRQARWGWSVDYGALSQLSLARRNNVLRYWCQQVAYPLPDGVHLDEIQQQFFSVSALLSSACVTWTSTALRQFSGRIYLMPSLPTFDDRTEDEWDWDGVSPLNLGAAGQLKVSTDAAALKIIKQAYTIRFRKGGERCTPSTRKHSQTIKKLLQEYQLETWLRDRVPLIYAGDELVAVGDLWVNKGYGVDDSDTDETVAFMWQCC